MISPVIVQDSPESIDGVSDDPNQALGIEATIDEYKSVLARASRGDTLPAIQMLLKVINKQGHLVPLILKPAQQRYWDDRSPADIVLKAAQMGFTTIVQAEFFLDAMVIPGIEVLILAQRDATAMKLFEISNTFRLALPEQIRPKLLRDTTHIIEFDHSEVKPGLKSTITVGSAESRTFGRGRPTHRLLATEVGFYDDEALKVIAGIVARQPRGSQGEVISRRVEESTADGQNGYFFDTWNLAVSSEEGTLDPGMDGTDLKPHFFPWFEDPEYRIPFDPTDKWGRALGKRAEDEQFLSDHYRIDDDQLRWRRWQIAQLGRNMFKQEFPENPDEAFLPVGSAVFTKSAVLDILQLGVRTPINPDYKESGWSLWSEPLPGRPYIVSVDQASGEGDRDLNQKPLDFQCITVWDAITLEQMATFRKREVSAKDFAIKTAEIAVHYNNALVVPETNLARFGFMDWLWEFGVLNIYVHTNEKGNTSLGIPTNVATKPAMKDNYKDIIEVPGGITIHSQNLVRETRNYRWLRGRGKNRMGAPPGMNDDELMTAFFAVDPHVREQARMYSGKAQATGATSDRTDEVTIIW
jgi:hypothetical protein